jgi:hypothetical protein
MKTFGFCIKKFVETSHGVGQWTLADFGFLVESPEVNAKTSGPILFW